MVDVGLGIIVLAYAIVGAYGFAYIILLI